MSELTAKAALEFRIKERYGEVDVDILSGCLQSSRSARIILSSNAREFLRSGGKSKSLGVLKKSTKAEVIRKFATSEIKRLVHRQRLADEALIEHRHAACMKCPRREAAPDNKLYHLGKRILRPNGDDICGLCGCFISEKIRRMNETCPDLSEGSESKTRWGDERATGYADSTISQID